MTISYLWSIILLPIFGWVSDKIGRKTLIIISSIMTIVFILPMFGLLSTGATWAVLGFMLFNQTVIAIMTASYLVLLPQAFQTIIRYTGTAFSYNITYTITALLPLAVNYSYAVLKKPYYLAGLIILLAIIASISAITIKINHDDIAR